MGSDLDAHVQGAIIYEGSRNGDLRVGVRDIVGDFPSYTQVDLSAGVSKENWSFELYATNLFDSNAITSRSVQCPETTCGDPDGLTASGGLELAQARWGVVALLASASLAKSVLAFASGGPRYGAGVAIGLGMMVAAAAVVTGLLAG